MARPLRIEYPGAWYHVLNRGRRKEKIFFCDQDYEYFLELLGQVSNQFKAEVHAYSLMPNHYHIIISTPHGNISRIMRHINGVYTQYINHTYKLDGSLFRGRYKAILIEAERYLLELVRYIHRNPLKAKLERRLGEHKWTSHRMYMRKAERPKWLVVKGVLERFSKHEKEALKQFEKHVRKEVPRELEEKLDSFRWPAIIGGDTFKNKAKEILLGKELDFSQMPDYKKMRQITQVSAKELFKAVKAEYGKAADQMRTKRCRSKRDMRRAFIYVCKNDLQLKAREIKSVLGEMNSAVLTREYKAAADELNRSIGCSTMVEKMEKLIKSIVKT